MATPAHPAFTPAAVNDEHYEYVLGLRQLADFLGAHPEFIPARGLAALCCVDSRAELVAKSRTFGTYPTETRIDEKYFRLTRRFGPHEAYVFCDREIVCEPVERTVTEWQPAPGLLMQLGLEEPPKMEEL